MKKTKEYLQSLMCKRLKHIGLLFFCAGFFLFNVAWSDTIEWKAPREIRVPPDKYLTHLYFKNASYQPAKWGKLPVFNKKIALKRKGRVSTELIKATYKPLNYSISEQEKQKLSNQIQVESALILQRKKPYAVVSFVPIRKNPITDKLERLVSFELDVKVYPTSESKQRKKRIYTANSVLAQGNWYKFSVRRNGLFKLDYDFLQELGLNVDKLNPAHIRIYGNGGGMLPESNAVSRYDDLQENAIRVVGGGDGSFDQGDYIVMYAEGPHQWYYDSTDNKFHHQHNIYANKNYYFITADLGPGQRVQTQSSTGGANTTVTTFDDFAYHEKEQRNLTGTGRRWFGELFDSKLSYDFSFTFPNRITNAPVYLNIFTAAQSTNGKSRFNVLANSTNVLNYSINTVSTSYPSAFAKTYETSKTFTLSKNDITITTQFSKPNSAAKGWLNFIELNVRRNLKMNNDQMPFRDANSVDSGKVSEFILAGADNSVTVWEITDPLHPKKQQTTQVGSDLHFTLSTEKLRTFIAFNGNSFFSPEAEGSVSNQNLHGIGQKDMIILVPPDFKAQAERLADFHRSKDGLSVKIVTPQQVYNEFSSGRPDVAALRDFMKMLYDRAGGNDEKMPDYLLLFGDGSYDYKNISFAEDENTNFILTYQSRKSLNSVSSFTTDDFYALLDDNEGTQLASKQQSVDIGVGRLPVKTEQEAKDVVDKILHYASTKTLGSWRNNLTFIADDEDNNLHLNDANQLTKIVENNYATYNVDKIYFDAYQQTSTAGGERYPEVNEAINAKIFSGTLIMNYTGHGGELGWSHERVLGVSDIESWENYDKLPLFVTATCEFSRYDDPARTSAGELTLLADKGGSIGLMTTVRLVYASENQAMATNFYKNVFKEMDGEMPALGDVARVAKNNTFTTMGNRKFTLLGDPALKLRYPQYTVKTTKVNNTPAVSSQSDTLEALEKVTIQGIIQDESGNKLNDFNGTIYPTVFDKPQIVQTLANDPKSKKRDFKLQDNILYRGKASVEKGTFKFSFIVPKDINYQFGYGKLSYYANTDKIDATGAYEEAIIGGTAEDPPTDEKGPQVNIYMNDKNFAFGGMTDESPIMIIELQDKSGINTVGNGIGHDITADLDKPEHDGEKEEIVLNQFYEADLNSYQSGEVRYPLNDLKEGRHEVSVKAWDVYNNSGEGYTEFVVAPSEKLALKHVLNYPNPFTTNTSFQFEHNHPGDLLDIRIQIFTVSGKLVKTIQTQTISDGYRVTGISWSGLDDYGDKIGRGVYIYRLTVRSSNGEVAHKFEKLVILR